MPAFYEDAAHLLRLATGLGLAFAPNADYRAILRQLAEALRMAAQSSRRQSHFDLALSLLAMLEGFDGAHCDPRRRARLVVILGTAIGNFLISQNVRGAR